MAAFEMEGGRAWLLLLFLEPTATQTQEPAAPAFTAPVLPKHQRGALFQTLELPEGTDPNAREDSPGAEGELRREPHLEPSSGGGSLRSAIPVH